MPTIRIDDIDVPAEERTLSSRLEAFCPNYDFEITLRESEWIAHAVEHTRIFLSGHSAAYAVGGFLLKTIRDIFVDWAKGRLKRAPGNTEKLTIYGPDRKPIKIITVKSDSVEE